MKVLQTFGAYLKLQDKLMNLAKIEDVLEKARLLTMNLAHHELKLAKIPLDDVLSSLTCEQPNED